MHEPNEVFEPDDLLRMPDGDSYELVDGRLSEKRVGAESEYISATLVTLLNRAVFPQRLGYVFGSRTTIQCFSHRPRLVRMPDVCFVARGRFPDEVIP
jgi:hypothetical protein